MEALCVFGLLPDTIYRSSLHQISCTKYKPGINDCFVRINQTDLLVNDSKERIQYVLLVKIKSKKTKSCL